MRYVGVITILLLVAGCTTRVVYVEDFRPVYPVDDLQLPQGDTTLTATITMLSDKMQVLDVVSIENGKALRRARLVPDKKIIPNHGGIIEARVEPTDSSISGYMTYVQLKEWEEYFVDRKIALESVNRALKQQQKRLNRLIGESGFKAWAASGDLVLEGYDKSNSICVYSMVGEETETAGIVEKRPMLIVWATTKGRIKRMWLTTTGQLLERS